MEKQTGKKNDELLFLRTKISALFDRILALEMDNQDIKERNKLLENKVGTLESKCEHLEEENFRLTVLVETIDVDVNNNKSQLKTTEKNIGVLGGRTKDQKEVIVGMNEGLKRIKKVVRENGVILDLVVDEVNKKLKGNISVTKKRQL